MWSAIRWRMTSFVGADRHERYLEPCRVEPLDSDRVSNVPANTVIRSGRTCSGFNGQSHAGFNGHSCVALVLIAAHLPLPVAITGLAGSERSAQVA
jgi:hypothetical protein